MNVLSLFDGKYEVSTSGKIYSTVGTRKELIGKINKSGYREVLLTINKKRIYKLVHRLIAESFIKNPNNLRTVNHKNGNKLDNCVDNLEWMTDSQNLKHARDNNLLNLKLSKKDIELIKSEDGSHRFLAKKYNISKTHVGYIKRGLRWKE